MADIYVVGDPVVLTNTFSVNGTPTDPTTIALAVTKPDGTTTTYTYAAAQITKTGTGIYTKTVTTDMGGTWSYSWTGTGTAADVKDGQFRVWATVTSSIYASVEDLKAFKNETRSTDDWSYRSAVNAASRAVDNYCCRHFYLDAATAKTYRATNSDTLSVDDIGSATGLVVATDEADSGAYGTTWTLTTDYVLEPPNAIAAGYPITAIGGVGTRWFPTSGRRPRVSVTARWGWPAVPDPVFHATLLLANRYFVRKDAPHGVAGVNDFGVIRISANDADVRELLAPYRAVERTFA